MNSRNSQQNVSDNDLAALFGLSGEEMEALGLDGAAAASTAWGVGQEGEALPADGQGAAEGQQAPAEQEADWPIVLRSAAGDADGGAAASDPFENEYEIPWLEPAPAEAVAGGPVAELAAAFAEESAELLDGFHVELEALESASDDWRALREARRTVHTLKGAAAVCGFERVVRLSHACETLLDGYVDGATPIAPVAVRLLFDAEPVVRQAVEACLSGGPAALTPVDEETIAGLTADAEPQRAAPAPSPLPGEAAESSRQPAGRRAPSTLHVSPERVDDLVDKVTEVLSNRAASQEALSRLVRAATEASATAQRLQGIAAALAAECAVAGLTVSSGAAQLHPAGSAAPISPRTTARLCTLLLQLEEATADEAAVLAALKADIVNRWALGAAEQRLDGELHGALLGIRLIPLGSLRVRLDRAVRTAAAATGKAVTLRMEGGEVAVEKNVFDRLYEPLLHLLRNAVDHAIEPLAERRRLGKPDAGAITITVADEGSGVVVRIADDGRGIDPTMVAAHAVERGIIPDAAVAMASDREKQDLIFTHGFSTAATVGDLSGRGLGLDIVRETCTRMGGTVELQSTPGRGTVFILRLPATLSLARVLVIRDGAALAALPAGGVHAVHLVPVAMVEERGRDGSFVRLGPPASAQALPLVALPLPPEPTAPSYVREGEVHVLEIAHEEHTVGLLVEELVVEEEAVVKPLPSLLRPSSLFLGAIILASGEAAPLLNLSQVLRHVRPARLRATPASLTAGKQARVLVVDDSLSMRVALTQTLEQAGYAVETAQDGRQALEVIATRGLPDLITLDVEMPRMNGMEALYAIRHSPGGQTVPIFMISSRAAEQHRQAALDLGATRYFTKPYPAEQLLAAAHSACPVPAPRQR